MDDNLDKKKKKKHKKSKEKQVKHIDTQDVQIESKKRKLDEEVEPEDYPYQTDPSDHCETPLEAYADIKSALVSLAHLLNKSIKFSIRSGFMY
jgi:hypothetical protein